MLANPVYKKHMVNVFNWHERRKVPLNLIRMVALDTPLKDMKKGEMKDDREGSWWLACPGCGRPQVLDHNVTILEDRITIVPSVECGYDCGFHEVITGWEFRRVGK